jgi:hypothetical protein
MSTSFLVHLAQSQFGKSHYSQDIDALQKFHTASGTSFTSLDDLCYGLERLNKLKGLPYGGVAPISKPSLKPNLKKSTNMGFVAVVQDDTTSSYGTFKMHKESLVGTVNLSEDFIKQLHQMFKCVQCCSNDHTLLSCPLMKNWIIKKKNPHLDNFNDSTSQARQVGSVNSVMAENEVQLADTIVNDSLTSISEEDPDQCVDFISPVEFDLLEDPNSLDVMTISGQVSPYLSYKFPLGSVHSIFASQITSSNSHTNTGSTALILLVTAVVHDVCFHLRTVMFPTSPLRALMSSLQIKARFHVLVLALSCLL